MQCSFMRCRSFALATKDSFHLRPIGGQLGRTQTLDSLRRCGAYQHLLGRARILCFGAEAPEYLQQGLKTVCETCAVPKGTPVTFPTLPRAYARAKTNAAPAGLDFAQSFHPANSE